MPPNIAKGKLSEEAEKFLQDRLQERILGGQREELSEEAKLFLKENNVHGDLNNIEVTTVLGGVATGHPAPNRTLPF